MAYNNQTFTAGQPISAGMIDYIDDAVDRLDEIFGDYKYENAPREFSARA